MPSIAVAEQGHRPPGIGFTLYADGVIHLTLDHGAVVDVGDSRAARALLRDLGRTGYVVVGDLTGVPFVDRAARAYMADDEGMVLATAVVTGRDGPIGLLVDRWLADHTVARPVAKFETVNAALDWAHAKATEFRAAGQIP